MASVFFASWCSHLYILLSHTELGLYVACSVWWKAMLYIKTWRLLSLSCISGALILLTLGKTSCQVVKALRHSGGDAHVGKNWGLLVRANFSLPTLCTTYLRNRPSSPVRPSGVYSLSQHLTERHEKSLPRSTQPAYFWIPILQKQWEMINGYCCAEWLKFVTQHWKMNISVVHYFCTFILGGRDPLMVCK